MRNFGIIIQGLLLGLFLAGSGCSEKSGLESENHSMLETYNVVWDAPSKDHHGSMPVGNGDIGLNVWVEENGDICFYIGKTDSWDDNGRLLKVGKIRIKCEPQIIFPGAQFRQKLDLLTGSVEINTTGELNGRKADIGIKLWVDAHHPVIHLAYESSIPLSMTAGIELWRNTPDTLQNTEVSDLLTSQPDSIFQPVVVEPDAVITNRDQYIGWYHHNKKSVGFDITNKIQGLSEFFDEDPILHRTFGAILKGTGSEKANDHTLQTSSAKKGSLSVFVLTSHPSRPEEWQSAIEELADRTESISFASREKAHLKWWSDFWNRSWIYAKQASETAAPDMGSDAHVVTRSYILQRFIDASAGRGQYPIKFNGSIFTVPAKGTEGDADYRRWGPCYWWQNTRLPYLSMCTSGDFDLLQPLFNMYAGQVYELSKLRTHKYFGFDGVYYPECITFWGSVFLQTYGWTPYELRDDPLQESGWHKWEWVAGPELVFMMLDYYDYTQDQDFLRDKIIPLANDIMKFFDNYYPTNESGKLVMYPSMAAETWWDCTNPMPELSGLHAITRRLLNLPANLTGDQNLQAWNTFFAKLPEIPLRETPSGPALAPAERFEVKNNVENPELYAIFPFRLYGVGNPDIEHAKNALEHRWDRGSFGWRQDDIFKAYLGLTDQAREYLVERSNNYDKNERFPAFWGPNYDWTPDQDHGGVLMKTFQSMLMQADPYSEKIYLFPAWPEDWDTDFRLHAPYNTLVEGKFRNGKLEWLKVTPESRAEDVIVMLD
jgi:alpha-L-fucosidase 2